MATQTPVNYDVTVLKKVLEDSGYFSSVTDTATHAIGTSTYTGLECNTDDLDAVLFIGYRNGDPSRWSFHPKSSAIQSVWYDPVYLNSNAYRIVTAVQCSGGLLLFGDYGSILITKTNQGKILIAGGVNGGNNKVSTMASLLILAEDDSGSYGVMGYSPTVRNQSLLIPLVSCSNLDITSYTTTAFIYSTRQNILEGYIQYNGKRYYTDGYFTVEDEEGN